MDWITLYLLLVSYWAIDGWSRLDVRKEVQQGGVPAKIVYTAYILCAPVWLVLGLMGSILKALRR